MTTWPAIAAAAHSLRTAGGVYEYVAAALEYDHQFLREESMSNSKRETA